MQTAGVRRENDEVASRDATTLAPYVPRQLHAWPDDVRHRDLEGTLVSADLSGFTRLSERLASIGREGAEELTTLLTGCFTGMIAEIERFGGDVLKFGGDALLVLYQGPQHTERACFSTIAMRDLIARPLATSTGMRVRLRISQGLHAGTFSCFVVDGNHREFIITGPGVTETVECEAAANPGQILLSNAAAAGVDRSWWGRPWKGRRLLRRIVVPDVDPPPAFASASAAHLAAFVPAVQGDQISIGAPSEHRRVTTAFCKFAHTDALLIREGPGVLGSRLQLLATLIAQAEVEYGVHWLASDVYPDGGKAILTAGAPVSHGDDEERMLRASRFVLDGATDLDLRIGVNAGPVFVGDLGSPNRRSFTVMGDAVNLAARLMQTAESGQLVASDAVLDHCASRFATTSLEPFFVKGKTMPIQASVVGTPAEKREQIGQLDLIGRDVELAVLLDGAAAAHTHRGRVVEIVGEPGAGKSRLLEELRRREAGLAVLTAQCGQYAQTSPYFAVRPMLRAIAGIPLSATPSDAASSLTAFVEQVAPELSQWLPLLAIPFDADIAPTPQVLQLAPQFRRARSHVAVAALLARAVTDPALLLIEDLHWIDDPSRDLVGEILAQVPDRPWLLVLTRRPGAAPLSLDADSPRLELTPLSSDAALELVLAAVGTDSGLRPADWDRLVTRAGGNPLFAIELAGAARSQGSADALADSVESLVTSKIDTLPARDRLLLREGAVLGAVIDLDLLADALEDDTVRNPQRWRDLEEFLVWRDGTLRFRHAIHQHVAYEGLSYRRRREMHARAARAIQRQWADRIDSAVGLLSTHYSRAGDDEPAWRYSVIAGDEARDVYANVEAAEFYSRALESARALPEVGRESLAAVAEALGDVSNLNTQYDEARRAYALARKNLAGAPVHCAEIWRKEGRILEREGRYTQALRVYSKGLKVIADQPDGAGTAAAIFAAYGSARYRQGRLRDAVVWARRAIADAERTNTLPALAHALRLIELCLEELGDPARVEYRARALPIYEQLDDQVGLADELSNLASFALSDGRFDESRELFERSRGARARSGDVMGEAIEISNIGEVLLEQYRGDEARDYIEQARRIMQSAEYPMGMAVVVGNLGRAEALAGDGERGCALLDEAIARALAIHAATLVNELNVRKLEIFVASGRDDDARTLAEELAPLGAGELQEQHLALLARLRAWLALRAGDLDTATNQVEVALGLLAQAKTVDLALTLQARAEICRRRGDADAAAADESTAEGLLVELGVVSTPILFIAAGPD